MKKILIELAVLIGIGGLLWAAITIFVRLPERPVVVSVETEKEIGENYLDMILAMNDFRKIKDPYIDSVLAYTAERLRDSNEDARFSYNITLVDNGMVNAFALPGGFIVVTTGLLNFCETPEELIGVISHEIGHIEHRHVITRLIKDFGLDLLTSNDPFVTGEIAKTVLSTGYNRRQEDEADQFAGELMIKNNMEPRVLAQLFRRLQEEKGEMPEEFEFISSHPNLDSRIRQILAIQIPPDFEPSESWIDWETFRKYANLHIEP